MTTAHERKLVISFILPARQNHYLELFEKPKRRNATHRLSSSLHAAGRKLRGPNCLAPAACTGYSKIASVVKCARNLLRCFRNSELDGKQLSLAKALKGVVGYGMGTFLSCNPDRFGYFEDADCRWILKRRP